MKSPNGKKKRKPGRKPSAKTKRKYDPGYTELFIDTAISIGLTRREAIAILHGQGYYLTKKG